MAFSENVKVCVRCRPPSDAEQRNGCSVVVQVDEDAATILLKHPRGRDDEPTKSFTFDYAFGFESKQLDIYNKVARPVVDQIFEGYNGTIFAYGQTGAGKTFTMDGIRAVPELRGIIPNSFAHIFGRIANASAKSTFLVHVSYLEIYNESIRDLLRKNQKSKLEIKERPDCGVCVRNLSTVMVQSPDEMEKLMNLGSGNRSMAATNMNEHSSRSHAIFSITIECSELLANEKGKHVLRQGKLHLVDLAGSERQSKTGAEGKRLLESNKINLSLATLGNVISALTDGKSVHVPYRNSKLTRLLQDSLGGNSKTLMIANIGPADSNYDESISTLRYANRAKLIKNVAKINEDPKDALIRQFQMEIEELRGQLSDGNISIEPECLKLTNESLTELSKKTNEKQKKMMKLSKEQIAEIESMIDAARRKLEEQKDLEVEQRDEIKRHLEAKKDELASAQRAQAEVRRRIETLESSLIVGGQNLLEKAEAQARLLEQSAIEMKAQEERAHELREKLRAKKEERINIEEKYNSLQEEAVGKRKKLQKLAAMYSRLKAELEDLRREGSREMDDLMENIRQLNRESGLQQLIINQYIPSKYQELASTYCWIKEKLNVKFQPQKDIRDDLRGYTASFDKFDDNFQLFDLNGDITSSIFEKELIGRNVQWLEDVGEWQLRYVACTGNSIERAEKDKNIQLMVEDNFPEVYLSYNAPLGDRRKVTSSFPTKGRKKRNDINYRNSSAI